MARKIETEQSKAKKKKRRIIITVIVVIVLIVCGFLIYKSFFKETKNNPVEVKLLDQNVDYGYSLSDRDSDLYKEEYNVLKDLLKEKTVDTEKYVNQVAKLFVIDLYSLSTKLNMYDVGGSEYYYADKKDMFDKKVMDTIYSTIEDDTYGDRKQELPLVSSINIESTESTTYKLGDKAVDAYSVKLKWTYEKDMGYDDEGTVVIAKEDGLRWSVVDFQPTLNPKYNTNKK